MLTYIDISKITPHPDNPRKNLGDLTELAESIKAQGILQNLTVIPDHNWYNSDTKEFDRYTVIIGHRRLAAAKLAGLTEVPCIISDMSLREQVATMLLENMQRIDLTIYEQAQGFQMMLNFGESVSDISEKTGFSARTVRQRVKLLELDQYKLKASVERGVTLQDFAELSKIEDIDIRNQVLESAGTQNWKWKISEAIENQEMPKQKQELMDFFAGWAKPIKNISSNHGYEKTFYRYKLDDYKKPKDADKGEYCYVDNENSATLYKKTAAPEKKKASEREKSYKERDAQVKELSKRAYQMRGDFVKDFNGGKKHVKDIMAFAMIRLTRYGGTDLDILLKLLELEIPESDEKNDYMATVNIKRDLVIKKYREQPERTMLLAAWASLDGNESYYDSHAYNFTISHKPNNTLDAIYDSLIALGYQISDEEQALRDGTHELFTANPER